MRLGLAVMFLNDFRCLYFAELSTGGSVEGGPSDRRPGRRSRRQKSSSRSSDGKNQPMLSETENTEIGSSMCLSPSIIFFLFLIKRYHAWKHAFTMDFNLLNCFNHGCGFKITQSG
jgi:hypothetical protein